LLFDALRYANGREGVTNLGGSKPGVLDMKLVEVGVHSNLGKVVAKVASSRLRLDKPVRKDALAIVPVGPGTGVQQERGSEIRCGNFNA